MTCSMTDCRGKVIARSFCRRHYDQWRRRVGDGRLCAVDECGKPGLAGNGYCIKHYLRNWQYGDPLGHAPKRPRPPARTLEIAVYADKFWARVDKSGECWIWTGHKYQFSFGRSGNQMTPQRYSYILAHGSAPVGLYMLRTCGTERCVRPEHLRAVRPSLATIERSGVPQAKRAMTHCKRGHAFEGENLHINRAGARVCRACCRFNRRRLRGSPLTFEPPVVKQRRMVIEPPVSDLVRRLLEGASA